MRCPRATAIIFVPIYVCITFSMSSYRLFISQEIFKSSEQYFKRNIYLFFFLKNIYTNSTRESENITSKQVVNVDKK